MARLARLHHFKDQSGLIDFIWSILLESQCVKVDLCGKFHVSTEWVRWIDVKTVWSNLLNVVAGFVGPDIVGLDVEIILWWYDHAFSIFFRIFRSLSNDSDFKLKWFSTGASLLLWDQTHCMDGRASNTHTLWVLIDLQSGLWKIKLELYGRLWRWLNCVTYCNKTCTVIIVNDPLGGSTLGNIVTDHLDIEIRPPNCVRELTLSWLDFRLFNNSWSAIAWKIDVEINLRWIIWLAIYRNASYRKAEDSQRIGTVNQNWLVHTGLETGEFRGSL